MAKDPLSKEPDPEIREDVVERAYEKGLLILGCGITAVRFILPLKIPKELVEEGVAIIEEALGEAGEARG